MRLQYSPLGNRFQIPYQHLSLTSGTRLDRPQRNMLRQWILKKSREISSIAIIAESTEGGGRETPAWNGLHYLGVPYAFTDMTNTFLFYLEPDA